MSKLAADISGWDRDSMSHGTVQCWPGVPEEIQARALEVMRELRADCPGLAVVVQVWPMAPATLEFCRETLREAPED
jgi:hypothetical protein